MILGIVTPKPPSKKRPREPEPESNGREPPGPPLSSLQRLALSRKSGSANSTRKEDASLPPPVETKAPSTAAPTAKPMSKLAQLAAARKAAATTASQSTSSNQAETPLEKSHSGSTVPAPNGASQNSQTPPKPLSKLAQKAAAAKAARAEADVKSTNAQQASIPKSESPSNDAMEVDDSGMKASPLFTFPGAVEQSLPSQDSSSSLFANQGANSKPSSFFTLLTARPRETLPPPAPTAAEHAYKSQEDPFSKPSPDELVLKARQGTAFASRQ